jgi:hypothetical protein
MLARPRANHFDFESILLSSETGSEPKIARAVKKSIKIFREPN